MKLAITLAAIVLLSGCRSIEMVSSDSQGQQTTYSAYFQNDRPTVAGKVVVDSIITLGGERLPKGYNLERRPHYLDGEVEAVLEVYFSNITDKPVEIQIKDYVFFWYGGKLEPKRFTIPPKSYIKSEPNVRIVSNYLATPYEYSLQLLVDDTPVELKGVMRRLTLEELKQGNKK